MSVLVLLEPRGEVTAGTLEAIAAGRRLAIGSGLELHAVWPAAGVREHLGMLKGLGIKSIHAVREDVLPAFSHEAWIPFLTDLVRELGAQIILGPASSLGKVWLASLAARLDSELAQDSIFVDSTADGLPLARKPLFAGKIVADLLLRRKPALVSLRPEGGGVERRGEELPEIAWHVVPSPHLVSRLLKVIQGGAGGAPLSEARVIVAGGRGIGGPENWSVLRNLCDILGGSLAASRATVDAGWIDHAHQVGQTGKVVNPEVYIACGISGAVQHLAGMRRSRTTIAINQDPSAEIFRHCDYGIVGDLFEVVPALVEALRRERQRVA